MSHEGLANNVFRTTVYIHGKADQRLSKDKWRDYISDLAWSRLGVEPAELSEIAVDCEAFRGLLGLLPPRLSPKEKRTHK